jgi:hypothetical protein
MHQKLVRNLKAFCAFFYHKASRSLQVRDIVLYTTFLDIYVRLKGKERRSCPIFSNILNALYRLEWVDIFEVSLSRLFQFEVRGYCFMISLFTFLR